MYFTGFTKVMLFAGCEHSADQKKTRKKIFIRKKQLINTISDNHNANET